MPQSKYQVLYSDVGGVLGTNGWDTPLRYKIAEHFGVPTKEVESLHRLMFDCYESGKMEFEQYLHYVFFNSARSFKVEDVRDYAYDASTPWRENIDALAEIKRKNGIKVGLISNEGGGLTQHRVEKFGLRKVADFMIFSYFVHWRKPDHDIWKLALNLAQIKPEQAIYIDDRKAFANIAGELGFSAIQHTSLDETKRQLKELGLEV